MLEIMPSEGAKKRFARLFSAARAAGVNSEMTFPNKDFGHRARSVFPETEDFKGLLRAFAEAVSCKACVWAFAEAVGCKLAFGLSPKR